jgi:hypothetical protein
VNCVKIGANLLKELFDGCKQNAVQESARKKDDEKPWDANSQTSSLRNFLGSGFGFF